MVATWIFPLAIVLSLPYESQHKKRLKRTASAVTNWLGSPQTSLTATIYNFRQIREAHRRSKKLKGDTGSAWTDSLYVLTCLNQFEVMPPLDSDGQTTIDNEKHFLKILSYGLFRNVVKDQIDGGGDGHLTRQLTAELAFQLRMLRRRAVIPTLASLATFLVAFVFSVVLSFAEVADSTTVDPLTLGLMFGWLPLLVTFSIVDRNPVSADRTA